MTFDDYTVKVSPDPTDMTSVKSCTLAVVLGAPNGVSYSVTARTLDGTFSVRIQKLRVRFGARRWALPGR